LLLFQEFDLPKYAVRFTTAIKYQTPGTLSETRALIHDLVERELSDTDFKVTFQVQILVKSQTFALSLHLLTVSQAYTILIC